MLKEFIQSVDTEFASIAGQNLDTETQAAAVQKAQNFYDRILDGYGDDSIGELGGAHLALENISMLGAKAIEDCRLGGSPLEKSTRYIYFDQKVNGEYLFYKEPILMTSAYKELFLETCTNLFDVYTKTHPPMTTHIEQELSQRSCHFKNRVYCGASGESLRLFKRSSSCFRSHQYGRLWKWSFF